MAVTPGAPTEDLSLTQQTSQYGTKPQKSVLAHMAKVAAKATQAEVNVDGYLKNPAYTRP